MALGPYLQTTVQGMDDLMLARQHMQQELKTTLLQAQERMKITADRNRLEHVFQVGDWVFFLN